MRVDFDHPILNAPAGERAVQHESREVPGERRRAQSEKAVAWGDERLFSERSAKCEDDEAWLTVWGVCGILSGGKEVRTESEETGDGEKNGISETLVIPKVAAHVTRFGPAPPPAEGRERAGAAHAKHREPCTVYTV